MKTVKEIASALNPAEMNMPYVKDIVTDPTPSILAHFANQPLTILVKRLYNSAPNMVSVDMTGAAIFRFCKKLEGEGKLTVDVNGVIVTSKDKNFPGTIATLEDETVTMSNAVVTPATSGTDDDNTPPWEESETVGPKSEPELIVTTQTEHGPKPLAFFCKMAVDQASQSDFAWCLNPTQVGHVVRIVKARFNMPDAAIKDLTTQFMSRFTKQYGRTTLLSPELLAWKYREARFFITTGKGIFNYVVRKSQSGGDIFPADDNFNVIGKARHYEDSWEGEMDSTMHRFFYMNVLLKEVIK